MPANDVPQSSEELVALQRRFYDSMAESDVETFANLISDDGCTLGIGSDSEEWWEGRDHIVQTTARQFQEFGGLHWRAGDLRAWSMGSVGWVVDRPSILLPDGGSLTCRFTSIYRLVAGQWRCVHFHLSMGDTNEAMLGVRLTTSLESLAEFAATARPDLSGAASNDGTVTIVFTDMEASTEAAERLGDARWLELLRWHDAVVTEAAQHHGGTVVKSQGDGYMLAFGAASRALDFALAVQQATADGYLGQPVRVRIGMNTGDAIRERDDFFGHAVIVASRVAAQAIGGEVLATALTSGLVAGTTRFEFGPARTTTLRGLQGEFTVRPLVLA